MAWTTFPTLTDGQVLTGAHMQIVKANFDETAPAKATTAGSLFVGTGTNAIAQRIPATDTVGTSQTTTSTSYVDLSTVGPAVTATTGTSAIVVVSCQLTNSTATIDSRMGFAVSGASTVAATDASCLAYHAAAANLVVQASRLVLQTLTAGSNTFTAKYRVGANTGTFSQRNAVVIPL